MFKVIIAGGRKFKDYNLLETTCDYFLKDKKDIEVVCGGAPGADKLGDDYAKKRGYPVKYFFADWVRLGKPAGPIRNLLMADYADALIAFWDGESPGTADMIRQAEKAGLLVRIVRYKKAA